MHETYVFRFTRAKFEPYDGIQLGGIALRSTAGDLLPIVSITNPGGTTPASQQPTKLIEYQSSIAPGARAEDVVTNNTGKWYDGSYGTAGVATLQITLASAEPLGSYLLATAPDVLRRDPVSWSVEAVLPNGSSTVVHVVDGTYAPDERGEAYPPFYLVAPPPSLPPPLPPSSPYPPSPPPAPPAPPLPPRRLALAAPPWPSTCERLAR